LAKKLQGRVRQKETDVPAMILLGPRTHEVARWC
jgi:hypothetical protein